MFVRYPAARSGAGFTLVEVLIAVLVLGLGLLGLAGLQTTSLRGTQGASQRIEAIQLSYEIADRIRANPRGSYDNQAGTSDDCVNSPCTADQLAGYDLNQWQMAVSSRLPNGAGWVCRDSTPDDGNLYSPACDGTNDSLIPYAIKIWWDEDRTGDVFKYQQFTTSFQP